MACPSYVEATVSIDSITDTGVSGPLGAGNRIRLGDGTLQFTGGNGETNREILLLDGISEFQSAIEVTSGNLTLNGIVSVTDLIKRGAGSLTLTGENTYSYGTHVEAGTLLVNNTTGSGTGTGNVTVAAGATLGGTGSISGSVDVENDGRINPGANTGTLTVGDVQFASAGELLIEIAGTDQGEFDQLVATGTAEVEGQLLVDLDNGFIPADSHEFTIVTAGTLTGGFSNLLPMSRVETLNGLGSFLVDIDSGNAEVVLTDFLLTNGLEGDYNADGIVNAADYVVWRNHDGTDTTLPGDTTPGMVTHADYEVWVANFGNVINDGSGAGGEQTVPESAAYLHLLSMLLVALMMRRNRHGHMIFDWTIDDGWLNLCDFQSTVLLRVPRSLFL